MRLIAFTVNCAAEYSFKIKKKKHNLVIKKIANVWDF